MRRLLILVAVTLGFTSGAELKIRVCETAPVAAPSLREAALVLDGLFRRAGIAVIWVDVDPLTPVTVLSPPPPCLPQRSIALRLVQSEPTGLPSTVLGYVASAAQSVTVTIVFRHVAEVSHVREVELGTLLGYVIAHELVHVLLQRRTHAPFGLMAKEWRASEFSMMRSYTLGLDVRDAERIRAALDGRNCENR